MGAVPTVIWDCDGTLFDCSHRLHHIRGNGKKSWVNFFKEIENDSPIEPNLWLYRTLRSAGVRSLVCTGRPADYREATERQLAKHGLGFDALYTRASGDFRDDGIVKKELWERIKEDWPDSDFKLCIDDRLRVVQMYRAEGLLVLQCAEGDF